METSPNQNEEYQKGNAIAFNINLIILILVSLMFFGPLVLTILTEHPKHSSPTSPVERLPAGLLIALIYACYIVPFIQWLYIIPLLIYFFIKGQKYRAYGVLVPIREIRNRGK
jgi:hypothetical protein